MRYLYLSRPQWTTLNIGLNLGCKDQYVRTSNIWQLFWQRANGKWVSYEPLPLSKDLKSLVDKIDSDPHGCFFG